MIPTSPRYKLAYGDVMTIDSIQGVTSEESIFVMPRGSDLVDAFRGYTAASRHRGDSYIICSEAAERAALERRRPIGASRIVTEDEIWARVAANLTREPAAVTATMLVAGARATQASARQTLALSLAPVEAAENRGLIRASLRRGVGRGREVTQMAAWAERVAEPLARQLADTAALARHLVGAKMISPPREAIEEAEPVGFGRARMLRRLEVWAHESIGPIGQQLSRAARIGAKPDWCIDWCDVEAGTAGPALRSPTGSPTYRRLGSFAGGLAGLAPPGRRGASQGNCRKIFEGEQAWHSARAYACWVRRRSGDGRRAGTTEADQEAFSEEGGRPGAVIEVPRCPGYLVAIE